MYIKALTFFAALVPLALGMPPEPSLTASSVAAIKTEIIPAIPAGVAAKPCPPEATARRVHPEGRPDLCLTAQGGQLTSGAEIGIHYCAMDEDAKSKWQKWDMRAAANADGGQIRSSNDTLCLSIGNDKENAARPHLEKCIDINTNKDQAQKWTLTARGVRNSKSSKCIDIRSDSFPYTSDTWNSLRDVQVWDCALGSDGKPVYNPQQLWTLMDSNSGLSGSVPGDERKRAIGRRSRP